MNELEIQEITKQKLLIPAGKCPVELEDSSYECVKRWISSIEKKIGPGFNCQPTVFRYWARMQLVRDDEKLAEVIKNINEITGCEATLYDHMTGRVL